MDRIFEIVECNDLEKKCLAAFELMYATIEWWDVVRATIGEEAVRRTTWIVLKEKFLEKYFLATEKHRKVQEFMDLSQGSKSVQEYTTQFERLLCFAPHMVDTTEKKI